MMKPDLDEIAAADLEKAIDFNLRHKSAVTAGDYLDEFVQVARQFGYATNDTTWGELEKELAIVFRNLVKYRRTLDFITECVYGSEDEDVFDKIIELGEEHWAMKRASKERIAAFMQRLNRAARS